MLKLATTLLGLTLTMGLAQAQNQNSTQTFSSVSECKPTGVIERSLQEEHGETPFSKSSIFLQSSRTARLYEGNLVIYINPKTKTYTLVAQFSDKISCILGAGNDFIPAFGESKTKL